MDSTQRGARDSAPDVGNNVLLDACMEGAQPVAVSQRRERTRQHYRLAAILFIGGGLGAVIPDLLHRPEHPATIYLLPLLAIVSGIVCWALADHLRHRFLHVVAVVATAEVALTVGFADPDFQVYLAFVAIFAAYVFEDRREIAFHVAITVVAAFAPLVYDPDEARFALIDALILAPTLVLAAGSVAYLRERLAASEERYRLLSERDPLTDIGNYRMLTQRVPSELRRAARFGDPLALLVLDLDGFKSINDGFGHQRGDVVLQEVAAALVDGVRDHDIVVRQGGDEFAVVAPRTDREDAEQLAARLREAIGSIAPSGTALGVSIGSAHFPDEAQTLEALLAVADDRLRGAKARRSSRDTLRHT